MPKLTQRFELGSNWTALKLPVVGTRLRGKHEVYDSLLTGTQVNIQ